MTLTWQQFAETVLAGIPWYIYLLTIIGLGILVRDTYNKIRRMYGSRKIMSNLSPADSNKFQP